MTNIPLAGMFSKDGRWYHVPEDRVIKRTKKFMGEEVLIRVVLKKGFYHLSVPFNLNSKLQIRND